MTIFKFSSNPSEIEEFFASEIYHKKTCVQRKFEYYHHNYDCKAPFLFNRDYYDNKASYMARKSKAKNPASNCGVAVTTLYQEGIVAEDIYATMMDIHKQACEAKHTGWSADYNFSYQAISALHENGIVDEHTFSALKDINAEGNKGKHW
jgi:hypothetical protein